MLTVAWFAGLLHRFIFGRQEKVETECKQTFAAPTQNSVVCIQSFYRKKKSIRKKNIPTLFSPFPILSLSTLCQNFLNGANALLLLLFITFKKLRHFLFFVFFSLAKNPFFVSAFRSTRCDYKWKKKKKTFNIRLLTTSRSLHFALHISHRFSFESFETQ